MKNPLKLGVNIDHVATIRQARGTTYPHPLNAAQICANCHADGLTIHLREDRRHINDADVDEISKAKLLPLNLEMAIADDIVEIACSIRPEEVCLVPEKRQEVTTEGGIDVIAGGQHLADVVQKLSNAGIEVSIFIDPDPAQIDQAKAIGAPVIELHTGAYCDAAESDRATELERLITAACHASQLGLKVNAGHGINLDNLPGILTIPHIDTLNIGHSIIARAVFIGLPAAIKEMQDAMTAYRPK